MSAAPVEALRVEGVSKHFGGRRSPVVALDHVDLGVPPGQLFGLIGHNGAGKSTLFKLVLGLINPTRGRIQVDGCDVGGPQFRAVRRGVGYLPENLVLYDNLSGQETLRFFARLKDAPAAQCDALLERVGLAAAGRRAVREYSKGMRQRLGFAQALLGEPRLLLLDEPTTGLDPGAIRDFYEQLDALRAQGVTILISSHILAELQQRVDALAMLGNGRILARGTVQDLRERTRAPLTIRMIGRAERLDALAAALALREGGAGLVLERRGPQELVARCRRERKMALLAELATGDLADLQVEEPTLEDVYLGFEEAA